MKNCANRATPALPHFKEHNFDRGGAIRPLPIKPQGISILLALKHCQQTWFMIRHNDIIWFM